MGKDEQKRKVKKWPSGIPAEGCLFFDVDNETKKHVNQLRNKKNSSKGTVLKKRKSVPCETPRSALTLTFLALKEASSTLLLSPLKNKRGRGELVLSAMLNCAIEGDDCTVPFLPLSFSSSLRCSYFPTLQRSTPCLAWLSISCVVFFSQNNGVLVCHWRQAREKRKYCVQSIQLYEQGEGRKQRE